jgi:phage-related holin
VITTKNRTEFRHMTKLLWALVGAMTAAVGSPMPTGVQEMGWLIVCLTVADTCVGLYVAARFRVVESRKFIEKLADKGVLFMVLGLLGFVASVMLKNWTGLFLVATGIVAYEVLSLIESGKRLAKREAQGSVLARTLDRIGKIFADNSEASGVTVEATSTQTEKTTVTRSTASESKEVTQ